MYIARQECYDRGVDFRNFFKRKQPDLACPDCWRFNQEEAQAAIDLVAADEPSAPDTSPRKTAADDRLRTIRRQFAAHRVAQHQATA